MRISIKAVLCGSVAAGLLIPVAPAFADEAADQAAASQGAVAEVDDRAIIVSARRRAESILKVPVVASVFDAEALVQTGAGDLTAIASRTPGLQLGSSVAAFGNQVALRGIGTTTNNSAIDQSVSLNIDGMQFSQGLSYALGFFDMQQVEVLKGPQALFFGKASPAGVISIRSADPGYDFEVSGRAGYEFEAREYKGELAVSVPLSETLRVRLAGSYAEGDGFFRKVGRPGDLGTLATLNPAQLFCVMTVGMAGVAGTILAAYASMGIRIDYLIAAAFMSAPGGILMAKLIMPDDPNEPAVDDPNIALDMHDDEKPANLIMAASQGAQTGVKLAVAVGAMVLAFVALVALANGVLGGLGNLVGLKGLSFQGILGQVFAPVMYLLGVPWNEAVQAGGLFGTKIVLNEFVAFIDLGALKTLSAPTVAIVTFALCGFANFSSIAIQMAVTGGLAPNQRPMIAKLGLKALAAGSLSNLMSAALAGLFLSLG